jgi:hypothetical protein
VGGDGDEADEPIGRLDAATGEVVFFADERLPEVAAGRAPAAPPQAWGDPLPSPPSGPARELRPGDEAVVRDMQGLSAQYNGAACEIIAFNEKKGRFKVQSLDTGRPMFIKPENLLRTDGANPVMPPPQPLPAEALGLAAVVAGLGRIVALYGRSFTSDQIH